MIRKVLRHVLAFGFAVAVFVGAALPAFTESSEYVPYESYTYWNDISGEGRKAVKNRPMYENTMVLDAAAIGTEEFTELIDVCTDDNGYVYLLDKGSRIIVLDEQYRFVKEITAVAGEEEIRFEGAQSISVWLDGSIYISDTENQRVLHCDNDGIYIDTYVLPDSPLIPENFEYRPIRAVADSKGYLYVLSEGSHYGSLLYAPDKSFIGFYGANKVTNGIVGAVQSLLNRMFPNSEKASRRERVLPYSFSDIVIDGDNFVYTVTDSSQKAQVKKLEPGSGGNILHSDDVSFTDDEISRNFYSTQKFTYSLIGIEVDEDEFMYCLDGSYGRVYMYDSACRMITAFGGGMLNGNQKGTFVKASAIAIKDGDILISDKGDNTLAVFRRNAYGEKVHDLITLTLNGDYLESKTGWEEVLKEDKNLQAAYNGLARAYLAEERNEEAMEMAKEGYDRETYALAYEYWRKDMISQHFGIIFGVAVLLIGAITALLIVTMKKKVRIIRNEELHLMFQTLIHPGETFEKVKYESKGSVKLSVLIVIVFFVAEVLRVLCGGFLFTGYDPGTFHSIWVFVRSAGLVILWVISNWLVCSLMEGKGTFREITVVTCYSILPLIAEKIIWTILTRFLLPSESGFLNVLSVAAMLYALFLFIIGMMRIHDYSMGRFIGTSCLSVLGIAVIVFLLILVWILLQQLVGFLSTVVIELLM